MKKLKKELLDLILSLNKKEFEGFAVNYNFQNISYSDFDSCIKGDKTGELQEFFDELQTEKDVKEMIKSIPENLIAHYDLNKFSATENDMLLGLVIQAIEEIGLGEMEYLKPLQAIQKKLEYQTQQQTECYKCNTINTHNLDDFGFCRECLTHL